MTGDVTVGGITDTLFLVGTNFPYTKHLPSGARGADRGRPGPGRAALDEQAPARQLVADLVAAELARFDFSVMSDHYFPWLEEMGHSPNARAVLGAAAQATARLPLMTFVSCPTFRTTRLSSPSRLPPWARCPAAA